MISALLRRLPSLIASLALSGVVTAQAIVSRFDTGNDGWVVVNTTYSGHITNPGSPSTTAPWDSTEGLPAGSLRVGDLYGETGVSAPAAFLGNRLPWYGGSVSWDIQIRFTDGVTYPAVWLIGATKTLVYDTPSPALNVWEHVSVPLTEAGWHVNGWQGAAATRSDMMLVLADLRGIYFNTEWKSGPDDTNFDNPMLAPPATGVSVYGSKCLGGNGQWPNLFATGSITSGGATTIELRAAPAFGIAALVLGSAPISVPLFGCEASILPTPVSVVLLCDGSGAADLPLGLPIAAPGPLAWLQAVCLDNSAPSGAGLVLSNGLSLTVQ